jgi:hypothetical protein
MIEGDTLSDEEINEAWEEYERTQAQLDYWDDVFAVYRKKEGDEEI